MIKIKDLASNLTNNRKSDLWSYLWNNKYLYLMVIPGVIWFLIFSYEPMYGILIAFKDYDIAEGVFGSRWVGLKYFLEFFNDYNFKSIMTNTIGISLLKLLIGFPAPIILAIMLNEATNKPFKKVAQTISYLPYFISWVVAASIWIELLSVDYGVVNTLLQNLGLIKEPILWFGEQKYFWGIVVLSDIWKNIGWGSIIYLAALSGVNIELYESAVVDGASKLRQIWHITLPSIKSVITIMFIFAVGNILNAGFDQIYVLQNSSIMERAEIIDTYIMTAGIYRAGYSVATAVGVFKSVVGLILLFATNTFFRFLGEDGIV